LPAEAKLVAVYTGSYLEAQVMKSHLESEGIPAILQYEGAGLIYGITVDGLGEEAREILRGGEELTD